MQGQRPPARRRSTVGAIALASLVVLGGFAVFGGYIEALLPTREETPLAGTDPGGGRIIEVPDVGWYDPAVHGREVVYMDQRYEIVGEPVVIPPGDLSAAATTDQDVRLFFRNKRSAEAKEPATYPVGGPPGTAGEWNRDASEHQGGGAGAMPYPMDRGTLYVKVGPDRYRVARPIFPAE